MKKGSKSQYLSCPLCDADMPMEPDFEAGDEVICTYCDSPLRIRKTKEDEYCLEEDF
ncbi:MAG: hypothetical protein HY880_03300 [Deltaproteobacteria bacterium]|nr:hypothetical protein [Deltaproteobacteria bacterium]